MDNAHRVRFQQWSSFLEVLQELREETLNKLSAEEREEQQFLLITVEGDRVTEMYDLPQYIHWAMHDNNEDCGCLAVDAIGDPIDVTFVFSNKTSKLMTLASSEYIYETIHYVRRALNLSRVTIDFLFEKSLEIALHAALSWNRSFIFNLYRPRVHPLERERTWQPVINCPIRTKLFRVLMLEERSMRSDWDLEEDESTAHREYVPFPENDPEDSEGERKFKREENALNYLQRNRMPIARLSCERKFHLRCETENKAKIDKFFRAMCQYRRAKVYLSNTHFKHAEIAKVFRSPYVVQLYTFHCVRGALEFYHPEFYMKYLKYPTFVVKKYIIPPFLSTTEQYQRIIPEILPCDETMALRIPGISSKSAVNKRRAYLDLIKLYAKHGPIVNVHPCYCYQYPYVLYHVNDKFIQKMVNAGYTYDYRNCSYRCKNGLDLHHFLSKFL
jgi:hypothetical protein